MQWKKYNWIKNEMYNGNEEKAKATCAQIAVDGGKMMDRYHPTDDTEAYFLIEVVHDS